MDWIVEKGLGNVQGITLAFEDPEPRQPLPLDYATTREAVLERLNREVVQVLRKELASWSDLQTDGRNPLCALKVEYQKWCLARYSVNPKRKRSVLLQSDEPPQEGEEGSNGGEAISQQDEVEPATTARGLKTEENPKGDGPVPDSHVGSVVPNTESWVTQSQTSYSKNKPRSVHFVKQKAKSEVTTLSSEKSSTAIVPTESNRFLNRGQSNRFAVTSQKSPVNTGAPQS